MTLTHTSLWEAQSEVSVTISSFADTLSTIEATRLRDLGLYESTPVICIRRLPFGGPIILQVGDNIFSLTKELASQIRVDKIV